MTILLCLCPDSPTAHTPYSFKLEKGEVTPLSMESEAFRKCSADLIREIQDPELLAWELYSNDVVLESVTEEVSMMGLSVVQRKTRLLNAVRVQIAIAPAKFQKLLLVLTKQPSLKDVAEKLKATYISHLEVGGRDTGLKGLFNYEILTG